MTSIDEYYGIRQDYVHVVQVSEFWILSTTARSPEGVVILRNEFLRRYCNETSSDTYYYRYVPEVEVFQAALDHITYNPHMWDQGRWLSTPAQASESPAPECGTAGCLAGTVVLQAGGTPMVASTEDGLRVWEGVLLPGKSRVEDVGEAAKRLLGTDGVADGDLFSAVNSLGTLWTISQALCGGALIVPPAEDIEAAQAVSESLYGSR